MTSEETPACPPVLLLTYRRPDTTRRVLETLRPVRPSQIFFAADAPRSAAEEQACDEVRQLAETIDWPCEVHRRFRETNTGLKDGVNSSIDWFFSQVNAGIILEDDCVPAASFFPFCAELLRRYQDHPSVMQISGNCHDRTPVAESYRFSRYPFIWGWATWAKVWQSHRQSPPIQRNVLKDKLRQHFDSPEERAYWLLCCDCMQRGKFDTWDYDWLFSLFMNDGLAASPQCNLVSNIGFGEGATHTTARENPHANRNTGKLNLPLIHPEKIEPDKKRDLEVATDLYGAFRSARLAHAKLRLTKYLPASAKRRLKKLFGK